MSAAARAVPRGMTKTVTYGVMPAREEFGDRFSASVEAAGDADPLFSFGRDPRVGTVNMAEHELWDELVKAHAEYEAGDEDAGDWCSAVLGCLDWEWV